MTTMSITLPDGMKEFLDARVAEEGHRSVDEYLQILIRDALRQKAKQNLIAKLEEALASGPAEPMTREDWDAIERSVWERHHRDQQPGSSRP